MNYSVSSLHRVGSCLHYVVITCVLQNENQAPVLGQGNYKHVASLHETVLPL